MAAEGLSTLAGWLCLFFGSKKGCCGTSLGTQEPSEGVASQTEEWATCYASWGIVLFLSAARLRHGCGRYSPSSRQNNAPENRHLTSKAELRRVWL